MSKEKWIVLSFKFWDELTTISRYISVIFLVICMLKGGEIRYVGYLVYTIIFNMYCFKNTEIMLDEMRKLVIK